MPYVWEWSLELSRMHAGMFDVQKIVKNVKLQTEGLETDATTGEKIVYIELDYRLNADSEWRTIEDPFTESPTQEVDFTSIYGVAGKRLKFRIRVYSRDASKTAVFLAIIIGAVTRVDVKSMYGPFTFLLEDNGKLFGLREENREWSAQEQLTVLEDWGDASNDSMLKLYSVASLMNEKMVFMNLGWRRQIAFKKADNNEHKGDAYVVSLSFQEA